MILDVKYQPSEISECALLDEKIKRVSDRIVELRKKKLTKRLTSTEELELGQMIAVKNTSEDRFASLKCREKIEYQRLLDTAELDSKYAVESEQAVLPKNQIEQTIYVAIGSVVVLTALFIIVKNTNK